MAGVGEISEGKGSDGRKTQRSGKGYNGNWPSAADLTNIVK